VTEGVCVCWGEGGCRKFTHRFALKILMNILEDFVNEDIKTTLY